MNGKSADRTRLGCKWLSAGAFDVHLVLEIQAYKQQNSGKCSYIG